MNRKFSPGSAAALLLLAAITVWLSLFAPSAYGAANTWANTGSLGEGRALHTAVLMPNGKVHVTGNVFAPTSTNSEVFDPATGTWNLVNQLEGRYHHTATVLLNGKVLLTGGDDGVGHSLRNAELYDPATGAAEWTGKPTVARGSHTATLLNNGKVLVAGGGNGPSVWTSAELYDPATGTWTATGSMTQQRFSHSATLLSNGKVLVVGGNSTNLASAVTSAELYDPATGLWTSAGATGVPHAYHTATLMPNGRVIIAGGYNNNTGQVAAAEIYDPASNAWGGAGSLSVPRNGHTATLLPGGKVCFVGGERANRTNNATVDLYDSVTGAWSSAGSLNTARTDHSATLLPSGQLLVAGGNNGNGGSLASAELYDSTDGNFAATGSLLTARTYSSATLLPNGKVLAAGGLTTSTAELYDPGAGTWSNTGALGRVHYYHTAALLQSGKVLVAGGRDSAGVLNAAETYDPATGVWSGTGALGTARQNHAATLLANGHVLVAGGENGPYLASAEIYNSATGVWSGTGAFATARRNHSLTLLPNGKVLLAGGDNGSNLASAQLFDPATGTWTATGSLTTARSSHTATLLPGGRVLVAGGANGSASGISSAEIYDPSTGTWTATGSLATARFGHTATLLPGGLVLVAGGYSLGSQLASAEVYTPATGRWSAAGFLAAARNNHTATLLPSGKVLVAAGSAPGTSLASAQLFDAGLGFSAAWQPVINSLSLTANNKLVLTGVRFRGISGASGGNGNSDSSTSFPLLQVRRLDTGLTTFLTYDPAVSISAGSLTSDLVPVQSAGQVLVTVFANGMPSQAWPVFFPGAAGITVEPSGEAAIADGGSASIGPAAVNASALRTFTIKNPGVGALNLSPITFDGPDAGSFAVATTPAASVAPGGSTTFTIRFTPPTRENKTAALHLPNNVSGSTPFDINLTGVILEPSIAVEQPPGSAVGSGGLRIVGPVAANLSTNKTFTIKNPGGVNLTGFAFTIDGPNAAEFSILVNPAGTVPPGGSTTFNVQFRPASTGLKTAVLHLTSNAANLNPYHIKLTGIAAEGKPFTGTADSRARDSATATKLPNGKVLVAGGTASAGSITSALSGAELYDPATGTWALTGSLATGRLGHTATLLNNGRVLVTGGYPGGILTNTLASAELYDPDSRTWSPTGSLAAARFNHTATLLGNGKVLVTGGQALNASSSAVPPTAEIYDPATGTWTAAGSPGPRHTHTATLLPNGKVLIAGGSTELFSESGIAGAQLYDPATGNWSATGPLAAARTGHSATLLSNGQVLVAGGGSTGGTLASAELYNPATGTWSPTGSLVTAEGVAAGGYYHTATLLSNDKVLVAGGRPNAGLVAIAALYDPATGSWTPAYNLTTARWLHTATALGGGRVLFVGGVDVYPSGNSYSVYQAELYDPSAPGTASWVGNGNMRSPRASHTATLLPDSTVLVAGGTGLGPGNQSLASAEIKARDTGTWTATGSLTTGRFSHTATLLSSGNATGKVLVAGGWGVAGPLSSAELYDPGSKTWTPANPMVGGGRFQHTATLLPNGKVLVTGGSSASAPLSSAEIYDPATGFWSPTGSLSTPRNYHTATLLPNGKVLVVGGMTTLDNTSGLSTAELYDPATGFWTPTGSLAGKRDSHTATLLPNGKVLVVGGNNSAPSGFTTVAEMYDPATGAWTLAGDSTSLARFSHTATVMPNGKVLIAGGVTFTTDYVTSRTVMLFDPVGNAWSRLPDITTDRFSHTAIQLHSGGILLTGGIPFSPVASTELYDLYLNLPAEWKPTIQSFTPDADGSLIFTGTGFLGITGFSPPTVQLRRLDNDQMVLLERDPATSPSATQFKTRPLYQIPYTPGYQMVTFTADGIPGPGLVFPLGPPQYPADIVVEGIGGEILPDGGTQSFGTPPVNYSLTTNFTIRNPGNRDLTGISVTLDGANAADFTVTASPAATVAGGGSTVFSVRFTPATAGAKTAAIHIANNVPGKSPYDISLTGTAQASQTARELWRQQYFGTTSNTGPAADSADPDGDGQNNDFEFIAGLVPTDRNSRFNLRVETVPGLPGPKRIFFSPLLPGRTYVVKSTTSLKTGPWTVLNGINTDTGTERRVTDIDALMGLKFYRVEITLSP